MIGVVAAVILTATSILLFTYGLNLLYLTWRATRLRPTSRPTVMRGGEPRVCIQLPVYNERYVAERVLDAACAVDWPADQLEVQVLDDSDDETVSILAVRCAHWRRNGVRVIHVRRGSRKGYKAGALAYGSRLTEAPFIAIFDADFVPPIDFLRRTILSFDNPSVAFVQARWGHLDENYSWFTRLQALFIDFHFLIEQAVRSDAGYLVNFTGSAGVWRREAIEDAGGWSARTLTEDLDLSYRAQLRGWKAVYLEDLVVPEELPVSIDAYRSQQSRWATGSFQCAFALLGPVWRSPNRPAVKVQATVHLLAYGVGPLMLLQLVSYPTLLLALPTIPWQFGQALLLGLCVAISPWIGFVVAQSKRGRHWWSVVPSLLCQVIGAGMSINVLIALFRATQSGGTFVRTPKHNIVRRGQQWRHQAYVQIGDPRAAIEALFGVGALSIVILALAYSQVLLAVYASMFAVGFLVVSLLSAVDFLEVITLGGIARRLRPIVPLAALFGLASVVLVLAIQIPEPFEDGYGHWLIAANLAATGHLHDPLFGMEDTWLPGYHVLAAAVLHLAGLWQLGALKALSAALALVTAACVYMLAPNTRQARIAVALLVLNPVFLFTSGSAVVEPLLTAMLTGAGLAAVRGRMKLAALLAALACATSTKAWVWVAAAAALAVVEALRSRETVRARVAWAAPAVALLVFLQLGFSPASHSVARGSVEVMSATGRGSIPGGALARVAELALTYGLATLPLVPFVGIGAALALRRQTASLWRFVYVPAAVYLAVVFALVASGSYTGSHRYLYPALPAMALLAAAALDRYSTPVRLAAVAASALLAVAFLPVFVGFAADNSGLVAAGRAASARPGMLLTDSPVVAYYSGRMPSEITGSQALPRDRDQAVEWMSTHGINTIVLEDISYYRATAVFPDLARGQATAPFAPIGAQSRYQASGGKPVFAYRLLTPLSLRAVNEGKTAPLAKGMTMGTTATGEGMGFGVPIVAYPDGWVYSTMATTVEVTSGVWKRTFQLDTIGGDAAHQYRFVPIASRGAIEVTYALDGNGVSIAVKTMWLAPGYSQVAVLNEQSALFNDFAAEGQPTLVGSGFGNWVPVTGGWSRLRSAALGLEWSVPALPGADLHAGRELISPDFNWAGLDYLFPASFAGATYHVNLKEAQ
jgi:cellulose synthase/poly-beta-1,6-N-acetylglucosamine synthase-like glycosyltransferase